jgi:hypothetical protein
MKARFTAWVARGNVAMGVLVIVVAALAAAAVFVLWPTLPATEQIPPREAVLLRIALALLVAVLGFAVGARLIVTGQILLVFLDMRRRIMRLDRAARRVERRSRPASPSSSAADRLRPR